MSIEIGKMIAKYVVHPNIASLQPGEKLVHFVRHAQGHHNVAGEEDKVRYQSEEFADAAITELGMTQCHELRDRNVNEGNEKFKSDLIVVSPLKRTLETATNCFPNLSGKIPWLAHESIREQTGLHPCDRRSKTSEYKTEFSHINFDLITDEEDPLYSRYSTVREPDEDVAVRSRVFFDWLSARDDKEVTVVTHSAFLRHTFRYVLDVGDSIGSDDAGSFKNCELKSFIISFN